MQLFSQYLRDLLQAKGLTVSALARLSGIERTALSKTLTGQRVLPYVALDGLIHHLRLTPGEERRLRSYYDAQFEKEGLRQSREIVGKLFSDLARLDFTAPAFEESRLLLDLDGYAGARSIFSGASNVHPLLRMILSQELTRRDARVELTVPPTDTFLRDELLRRYLDGRMGAQVQQIIAFDASGEAEDINLHNLECFCQILLICLLSKRNYHPYYYYDSLAARYTDPFPYFLVTHSCAVCLSEDGSQAMLLRGTDQVEQYHRHFQSLLKRCRQYGLPCSFSEVQSVDLYKRIRPFRKLLGLDSLKQKAIERFLGICRQDPFSGGQLIEVYQEYLVSRDDRLYGMLMLHNREDLEGMPLILPILSYPDFLEHEFVLEDQQLMESSEAPALRLRLRGCCRLPAAFSRESGGIAISASDSLLTLEIPLFAGTLKHFYPNYQDYYYLVCEDTAIHKSVGAFVDRNARKKATAATCYTKKSGHFLPQPVPIWEPVMKEDCRSRLTYVEYRPQLFQSPDCLSRYVREILKTAGR